MDTNRKRTVSLSAFPIAVARTLKECAMQHSPWQNRYAPLLSALIIPLDCMAAILFTIFKLCNVGEGTMLIALGGAANLLVFLSLMR